MAAYILIALLAVAEILLSIDAILRNKRLSKLERSVIDLWAMYKKAENLMDAAEDAARESAKSERLLQEGITNLLNYDYRAGWTNE